MARPKLQKRRKRHVSVCKPVPGSKLLNGLWGSQYSYEAHSAGNDSGLYVEAIERDPFSWHKRTKS